MQNIPGAFTILLVMGLRLSTQGQAVSPRPKTAAAPAPLYSISFERKDPVAGLDASPAIKLPFDCTADGTVFVTMVPVGGQMQPPLYAPPHHEVSHAKHSRRFYYSASDGPASVNSGPGRFPPPEDGRRSRSAVFHFVRTQRPSCRT